MLNKFSNLKPLNKNRLFFNKNGTYSAKGFFDNQKIKIYSPPDKRTINLRLFLETTECKKYFPRVIYHDEEYIAEEWIDSPNLSECDKQNSCDDLILEFIFDLQKLNYKDIVFDYLYWIFKRINKSDDKLLREIRNLKIPPKINHNDLNPDNILLTSKGIKIVDNEFLGNNNGWVLNLKNSFLKNDTKFYENYINTKTINELWKIRTLWKK